MKQFRNSPYYISQEGDIYRHCGEFSTTPFQYRKRKPKMNNAGYKIICIASTTYLVHALVAEVWISPRPEGMVCNHIDGNKLNNHYTNLEWITRKANQKHAIEMGLQTVFSLSAKVTESDIPIIRASTKTNRELGEEYGLSIGAISSIRNYRTWKHIPVSRAAKVSSVAAKRFSEEEIRQIRAGEFGAKRTAALFKCNPKTIKMIRNRTTYKEIV